MPALTRSFFSEFQIPIRRRANRAFNRFFPAPVCNWRMPRVNSGTAPLFRGLFYAVPLSLLCWALIGLGIWLIWGRL